MQIYALLLYEYQDLVHGDKTVGGTNTPVMCHYTIVEKEKDAMINRTTETSSSEK